MNNDGFTTALGKMCIRDRDMDEVAAGLMEPWEYRAKWHGEGEVAARHGGASGGSAASRGGSDGGNAAQDGVPGRGRRREERATGAPARMR